MAQLNMCAIPWVILRTATECDRRSMSLPPDRQCSLISHCLLSRTLMCDGAVLKIHHMPRVLQSMELLQIHNYCLSHKGGAIKTENPPLLFLHGSASAHNSVLLYVDPLVHRYFTTVLSSVTTHSSIHTAHLTLVPPLLL